MSALGWNPKVKLGQSSTESSARQPIVNTGPSAASKATDNARSTRARSMASRLSSQGAVRRMYFGRKPKPKPRDEGLSMRLSSQKKVASRGCIRGNLGRGGHPGFRVSCRGTKQAAETTGVRPIEPAACLVSNQPTVPPFASHAAADLAGSHPWPLEAFWPLHALLAVLQAL